MERRPGIDLRFGKSISLFPAKVIKTSHSAVVKASGALAGACGYSPGKHSNEVGIEIAFMPGNGFLNLGDD